MKWTARVSGKGQITIPKELRDCLGIEPDATLELALDGDQIVVRQRPDPIEALRNLLPPIEQDIEQAIRDAKATKAEREAARS